MVRSLPFDLVAPGDAILYFWRLPPNWKCVEGKGRVTVTDAAAGTATVSVQTVKIDFEKKDSVTRTHSLTVVVGGVRPAPPDPGPGPGPAPPDDPLRPALKAAYDAEADPAKAAQVRALAAAYRAAGDAARTAPTWGGVFSSLTAAAKASGAAGKVLRIQGACGGELLRVLGVDPSRDGSKLIASATERQAALTCFSRLAGLLEGLQ